MPWRRALSTTARMGRFLSCCCLSAACTLRWLGLRVNGVSRWESLSRMGSLAKKAWARLRSNIRLWPSLGRALSYLYHGILGMRDFHIRHFHDLDGSFQGTNIHSQRIQLTTFEGNHFLDIFHSYARFSRFSRGVERA